MSKDWMARETEEISEWKGLGWSREWARAQRLASRTEQRLMILLNLAGWLGVWGCVDRWLSGAP